MSVRARRGVSVVLGGVLICAGLSVLPRNQLALAATAASGSAASASATTVNGTGPFAGMKVTVSQTKSLTNQVVTVSWTGAAPTIPAYSEFDADFVQIMQCWGDDAAGPSPEQCQFGAASYGSGTIPAGSYAVSRGIKASDPLEKDVVGTKDYSYVPFRGADGRTVQGDVRSLSAAFTANETNEVPLFRTLTDGTGKLPFEVQTGLESAGLGCGLVPTGATQPHRCWLVVVPRGNTEVDGHVVAGTTVDRLDSSPLSATNWQHRIAIPLDFTPITAQCPIGSDERPVAGNETVAAAILPWQAGFCARGGSNLSFSLQGDPQARTALASTDPKLRILGALGPAPVAKGGTVYAPLALTGVTFAFLVERRVSATASEAAKRQDGQPVESIKLDQRLVAKLLTQSYGNYTWDASAVAGNPSNPSTDPEFVALNPAFADLVVSINSPLVSGGMSDAASMVWQWVMSDADARAFLAGKPDPWGMHLNTRYRAQTFPQDTFPRADTTCVNVLIYSPGQQARCSLERAPYAFSMTTAARQVFRGELQGHNLWDVSKRPPAYVSDGIQAIGTRSMSAVVDVPSATRYGLVAAQLRNAAGAYVAPTTASITAAAAAMKPGEAAGTRVLDLAHVPRDAYPLTAFAYAATAPAALSAADRATYSAFIRYVATGGQHIGYGLTDLPLGYVPLPAADVTEATAAAALIAAGKGDPAAPTPTDAPAAGDGSGVPTGGGGGTSTGGPPGPGSGPAVQGPSATPGLAPSGSTSAGTPSGASSAPSASSAPAAPTVQPVALVTPSEPLGPDRYAAVAALVLGGAALVLRGALPWLRRPGRHS
jgi:hypothetical protein